MSYDPRQPLRAANIPPVYLPNGTINPAYVAIHRMQAANFVRGVTINQQPKPAPAKPKSQAVKVDKQKIIEEDSEDEVGDSLEDQHFATVCTDSLEALGLRQHPNRVAEAASLSSVPAPDRQYALRLPAHVMRDGISAVQFQAVRLACARHETLLKTGARAGFFLGDGPGVGKGRQIAATIFNYFCQGKTKAVWVSVSTDLVVDARRDLNDIGALQYESVRLHDLRSLRLKTDQKLNDVPGLDKGILFCTYDLLISGSKVSKAKPKKQLGNRVMVTDGVMEILADPEDGDDDDVAPADEFGPGSRLRQIVEWLGDEDYCIVLDECHRAKNCLAKEKKEQSFPLATDENQYQQPPSRKSNNPKDSKTARAVVELQKRCPNARVLYVSATGATEAENLCYMERLGLWGEGTPYATKHDFVNMLKKGGVAAMELVAMELKQAGCYIARTLSYEGVTFEQQHHEVDDAFRAMYDTAVQLWQDVYKVLKNNNGAFPKGAMGLFYAAQLRFFRQLCTAAKVDKVIQIAQDALSKGQCPVIGLQSTGEARTAAFVAENGGDEAVFDSFVEPAALMLSNFVEKNMLNRVSEARELHRRSKTLMLPKNPLDDLIQRLGGPKNVAEMTGRAKRMIHNGDGTYTYMSRVEGNIASLDEVNIKERAAFQQGKKRVAIISDAASAGISLQADKNCPNQAKRVHITLELAWSADKTVQQLGRTHRSNQKEPPLYIILSSNISGEYRFASAVAHRLEQLGALTHGDRRAASAAEALSSFNLQNVWASQALGIMYGQIRTFGANTQHIYSNLTPEWADKAVKAQAPDLDAADPQYKRIRDSVMQQWFVKAYDELNAVGLLEAKKNGDVNKLLNRLLATHVEMQSQVFEYWMVIMEYVVREAKKCGSYNEYGIIKPGCEEIKLRSEETIYMNEESGLTTNYQCFMTDRGVKWEKAKQLYEEEIERVRADYGDDAVETCFAGFYFSEANNGIRFYCLALPRDEKGRVTARVKGRKTERPRFFRLIRPATGFVAGDVPWMDFRGKFSRINNISTVEAKWKDEYRRDTAKRQQKLHLISGAVLPLLPVISDVLSKYRMDQSSRIKALQLMRVETSDAVSRRFIGAHIPERILFDMLREIKALQPLKPWEILLANKNSKPKKTALAGAAAVAGGAGSSSAAPAPDAPNAAIVGVGGGMAAGQLSLLFPAPPAMGPTAPAAAEPAPQPQAAAQRPIPEEISSSDEEDLVADHSCKPRQRNSNRGRRQRRSGVSGRGKAAADAVEAPMRFDDVDADVCEKLVSQGLWCDVGELVLKPEVVAARAARQAQQKKQAEAESESEAEADSDTSDSEQGNDSGDDSGDDAQGAAGCVKNSTAKQKAGTSGNGAARSKRVVGVSSRGRVRVAAARYASFEANNDDGDSSNSDDCSSGEGDDSDDVEADADLSDAYSSDSDANSDVDGSESGGDVDNDADPSAADEGDDANGKQAAAAVAAAAANASVASKDGSSSLALVVSNNLAQEDGVTNDEDDDEVGGAAAAAAAAAADDDVNASDEDDDDCEDGDVMEVDEAPETPVNNKKTKQQGDKQAATRRGKAGKGSSSRGRGRGTTSAAADEQHNAAAATASDGDEGVNEGSDIHDDEDDGHDADRMVVDDAPDSPVKKSKRGRKKLNSRSAADARAAAAAGSEEEDDVVEDDHDDDGAAAVSEDSEGAVKQTKKRASSRHRQPAATTLAASDGAADSEGDHDHSDDIMEVGEASESPVKKKKRFSNRGTKATKQCQQQLAGAAGNGSALVSDDDDDNDDDRDQCQHNHMPSSPGIPVIPATAKQRRSGRAVAQQDNSGSAIDTAAGNEQTRGAVTPAAATAAAANEGVLGQPSDDELRTAVLRTLRGADIQALNMRQLLATLADEFYVDLKPRKSFIKGIVASFLADAHNDTVEGADGGAAAGDVDEDAVHVETENAVTAHSISAPPAVVVCDDHHNTDEAPKQHSRLHRQQRKQDNATEQQQYQQEQHDIELKDREDADDLPAATADTTGVVEDCHNEQADNDYDGMASGLENDTYEGRSTRNRTTPLPVFTPRGTSPADVAKKTPGHAVQPSGGVPRQRRVVLLSEDEEDSAGHATPVQPGTGKAAGIARSAAAANAAAAAGLSQGNASQGSGGTAVKKKLVSRKSAQAVGAATAANTAVDLEQLIKERIDKEVAAELAKAHAEHKQQLQAALKQQQQQASPMQQPPSPQDDGKARMELMTKLRKAKELGAQKAKEQYQAEFGQLQSQLTQLSQQLQQEKQARWQAEQKQAEQQQQPAVAITLSVAAAQDDDDNAQPQGWVMQQQQLQAELQQERQEWVTMNAALEQQKQRHDEQRKLWEQQTKTIMAELAALKQQQQQQQTMLRPVSAVAAVDLAGAGSCESQLTAADVQMLSAGSVQASSEVMTNVHSSDVIVMDVVMMEAAEQVSVLQPAAVAAQAHYALPTTPLNPGRGVSHVAEYARVPSDSDLGHNTQPQHLQHENKTTNSSHVPLTCSPLPMCTPIPAGREATANATASLAGAFAVAGQTPAPVTPGSDADHVVAAVPAFNTAAVAAATKDGVIPAKREDRITADDVRVWLAEQKSGATMPALLKRFGGNAAEVGSAGGKAATALRGSIAKTLQWLVNELDVVRRGTGAACSGDVDSYDDNIVYVAL